MTHQHIHPLVTVSTSWSLEPVNVGGNVPHYHLPIVTATRNNVVVRGAKREAENVFWGFQDQLEGDSKATSTRLEPEHRNSKTEPEQRNNKTEPGHRNNKTEPEHRNSKTEPGHRNNENKARTQEQ